VLVLVDPPLLFLLLLMDNERLLKVLLLLQRIIILLLLNLCVVCFSLFSFFLKRCDNETKMREERDFQISLIFVVEKERDFLKLLSLVLKFNSLSSGLSSFPSKNSQSVSLVCESLLSVFTHTQVVRTIATRRKQHTE
jgi:hypothetical protein